MTDMTTTDALRRLVSGEFSSIHISFNDFACNYVDLRKALEEGMQDDSADFWVSPEEREKAIATNSLWDVQWYPHTPIRFYRVQASTLEAAVEAALRTLDAKD